MNCKPGDRAIVTRVRPPSAPGKDAAIKAMLGRVVKVVRLYCFNGLPFWELEHQVYLPEFAFSVDGIEDYCLTPLRDDEDANIEAEHKALLGKILLGDHT